jgi:UDP-N-acetylmuramate--alanine ligase
MNKIKTIHFVGVKGVGMAPLAIIAKEAGFTVSGCDIDQEFITDAPLQKVGIISMVGFHEDHIKDCDLVITTGAHGGFDNVEVIAAKQQGIPVWTQGEAVGKFMNGEILKRSFDTVSVAGCHGKTTTTAMIATILKENKLDPSFLIGTGDIPSLGSCGHFGKGNYFVAEADEYATEPKYDKKPKFLWQKPRIGLITNIEFDHPDLYPSMDSIREAFLAFANNIQENGVLVACSDDPETAKVIKNFKKKVVTYGFSKTADFYIDKVSIEQDRIFFWVHSENAILGEFLLNVTGEHNALNALAAIIVCLELGLSLENIKKGLLGFKGTKRRMEYIGVLSSGAVLYDDYAHHPTEIRKTLETLKKAYMNKKVVCIFQPHTYSRTKSLFEQFINSFTAADTVILVDIFPSARESIDTSVSSKLLADRILRIHKDVTYIAKLKDVVKYVEQKAFSREYVLVTMGAGDVYEIDKELIKA